MYERMLNKEIRPSIDEIVNHIGSDAYALLQQLEKELNNKYDIVKELRFPYGNAYGWGFKYSHKGKHLCDVFFENSAISVTIQIGGEKIAAINEQFKNFLPKTKELWEKRYPCGKGGWIHYRVMSDREINDIIKIIGIKRKAIK